MSLLRYVRPILGYYLFKKCVVFYVLITYILEKYYFRTLENISKMIGVYSGDRDTSTNTAAVGVTLHFTFLNHHCSINITGIITEISSRDFYCITFLYTTKLIF